MHQIFYFVHNANNLFPLIVYSLKKNINQKQCLPLVCWFHGMIASGLKFVFVLVGLPSYFWDRHCKSQFPLQRPTVQKSSWMSTLGYQCSVVSVHDLGLVVVMFNCADKMGSLICNWMLKIGFWAELFHYKISSMAVNVLLPNLFGHEDKKVYTKISQNKACFSTPIST